MLFFFFNKRAAHRVAVCLIIFLGIAAVLHGTGSLFIMKEPVCFKQTRSCWSAGKKRRKCFLGRGPGAESNLSKTITNRFLYQGLGLGMARTSQYNMHHDIWVTIRLYHDTLRYDACCNIVWYSTQFTENVKTAEIQVTVYDLSSLYTSHLIMLII